MNNLMLISRCQYLLLGLKCLYEQKNESDGECLKYHSLKGCGELNLKNTLVIIDIRDDYFESFRLL